MTLTIIMQILMSAMKVQMAVLNHVQTQMEATSVLAILAIA